MEWVQRMDYGPRIRQGRALAVLACRFRRSRIVPLLLAIAPLAIAEDAAVAPDELSLADLMSITIVTASKTPEKINEAPGVISSLSREEIDRLGPATLREVLATLPGVWPSSGYLFERSSVAIQGDMSKQNTSHILLLVDGRPIREGLEGGLSSDILMGFPVSAIDHIEMIKGPGAVLYGTDAFTGVINILTRRPTEDRAKVSAMGSTDEGRCADGTIDLVRGDLKISQSATWQRSPRLETSYLWLNPATGATVGFPVRFAPVGGGAHTQFVYKDFTAFVGYAEETSFNQINGMINHTTQKKTYGNLGYDLGMSERWNLQLNAGITRAELRADTVPYSDRNSYEALAEAALHVRFGTGGKVVLGSVVDYREGEEKNWQNDQTMNDEGFAGFSGYGQVSYPVLKPLLVFGGFQYNQVSDFDPALVPRTGLIWAITERLSAKAFWTNAFRAPSLNELTIDAPTQKGKPDLRPETIETWDVSLSFNGNGVYASGNAFYSRMEDIIQPVFTGQMLGTRKINRYQNAKDIQLMGAGCEAKSYLTRELLVNASANYQEATNADDRWGFLPIPLYTGKLGASYVSGRGWVLGASALLNGAYSDTFTLAKLNPAPEAGVRADLFGSLELSSLLKLQGKQSVRVLAKVRNLFDEDVWIPEWGGSSDVLPELRGRTYAFGLEMEI